MPASATRHLNRGQLQIKPREATILGLIAQGYTYNEIAKELNVSTNTVSQACQSAYGKLNARNAPHAVAIAHACGYLPLACPATLQ